MTSPAQRMGGGVMLVARFNTRRVNKLPCGLAPMCSRGLHSLAFGRKSAMQLSQAEPGRSPVSIGRRNRKVRGPNSAALRDVWVHGEITNIENCHV